MQEVRDLAVVDGAQRRTSQNRITSNAYIVCSPSTCEARTTPPHDGYAFTCPAATMQGDWTKLCAGANPCHWTHQQRVSTCRREATHELRATHRFFGMVEPVARKLGRMMDAILWMTSSVPVLVLPWKLRPTLQRQERMRGAARGIPADHTNAYRLSAWELMRPSPLRNRSAYTPV